MGIAFAHSQFFPIIKLYFLTSNVFTCKKFVEQRMIFQIVTNKALEKASGYKFMQDAIGEGLITSSGEYLMVCYLQFGILFLFDDNLMNILRSQMTNLLLR